MKKTTPFFNVAEFRKNQITGDAPNSRSAALSDNDAMTRHVRFLLLLVFFFGIFTGLAAAPFSGISSDSDIAVLSENKTLPDSFDIRTSAFAEVGPESGITQQVIVRFDTVSDLFYDPIEQTSVLLSYTCEIPYVLIDANPEAAERINAVLADYHAAYIPSTEGVSTAADRETYMLSLAEGYYASINEDGTEQTAGTDYLFSFSHRSYVTRCDDSLIVFAFSDYTRNPQESDTQTGLLAFDAHTGVQLDLSAADLSDSESYPVSEQNPGGFFCVMTAQEAAEAAGAETEQVIDLLETDPEGQEYYMRVSGEIYDVRFSEVVYYDRCYEKNQLWYCNVMSNESLQLKISLPEGQPDLKISFTSPSFSTEASEYVFTTDNQTGLLSLKAPDNLNSLG